MTQQPFKSTNHVSLPGEGRRNRLHQEPAAPANPPASKRPLSKALNRFVSIAQQALNTTKQVDAVTNSNPAVTVPHLHVNAATNGAKQLSHTVANPNNTGNTNHAGQTAYQLSIKADAHRFRNQLETAEALYLDALALDPEHTDALIGLGKTLREQGRPDEGCRALRQALRQNAFNVEVQLELGRCYNEAGKPERAITWYERALKLDPANNDARFGLALLVELHGDVEYAATLYEAVLDQDENFLPAYNNLGSIYLRMGEYEASEGFFRELIQRSPEFHRGYLGLGITLDRAGRSKEALFYYRTVLGMKPVGRNNEFIETRVAEITQDMATENPLKRVK